MTLLGYFWPTSITRRYVMHNNLSTILRSAVKSNYSPQYIEEFIKSYKYYISHEDALFALNYSIKNKKFNTAITLIEAFSLLDPNLELHDYITIYCRQNNIKLC